MKTISSMPFRMPMRCKTSPRRRQHTTFQITVWSKHHDQRDCVAAQIVTALAALCRFRLPDGTTGLLRYHRSVQSDEWQKQRLYRRDLFYEVAYATTQT